MQIQKILLIEEGLGSTIDLHPQEGADIDDLALETEDRVQVPGTEGERNPVVRNRNGNNRPLSLKLLLPIQIVLVVMFQQFIINTRYS